MHTPGFRLMPPDEQQRLIENIARSLGKVPKEIQEQMIGHFHRADPAYGAGVERALGIT
jgi:catalase